MTIRRMLELASRNWSFIRHLPRECGRAPVVVSPDAALAYLKPGRAAFDTDLLQAASELIKPGQRVWDIGANVGVFTLAAAHAATESGHLLAVEADPWLAGLLRRTVRLKPNARWHIDVLGAAIAETCGVATFSIAERGRASNALSTVPSTPTAGGRRAQIHVPTLTLDTLLAAWGPPDFVKIDVEGAEWMVIQGGERLFSQVRPTILCEMGGRHILDVDAFLKRHDYELFDANADLGMTTPLPRVTWNTIARPKGGSH